MFVATGIFLVAVIVAAFFAFSNRWSSKIKKIANMAFWISLFLFLALLVVCIVHISSVVKEGMREKKLNESFKLYNQ